MCGLTGILRTYADSNSVKELIMATSALHHRGPDDEGFMIVDAKTQKKHFMAGNDTNGNVELTHISNYQSEMSLGFGFRRLSIQDLSNNGHQPMTAEWTKATIMFNGEIYNFVELREELKSHGYTFRSSGDSEVVLAAYDLWGVDCFSKLEGMWAIIVFDALQNKLILSRDPFGIKPLYYHYSKTSFKFASEIKSILKFNDVERQANRKSVFNYIRNGRPGLDNQSIFKDVLQIPPGHFLYLDLNNIERTIAQKVTNFQQVKTNNPEGEFSNDQDIIDRLNKLLRNAVSKHVRSDVPLAFNLSGGIDSSGLIAMAGSLSDGSQDFNAFSYISNEDYLSEEKWVDIVAEHIGVSVHKLKPDSQNLVSDIERMMLMQDEPIGSLSPYAQFKVFEKINAAGIKVSIDGQGADEVFGGYLHYLFQALVDHVRSGNLDLAQELLKFGGDLFPGGKQKLIQQTKNAVSNIHKPSRTKTVQQLLPVHAVTDYFASLNKNNYTQQSKELSLKGVLEQQLSRTSLPELLRLADRNSMGFSVESRVPYLDVNLVNFAKALPNLMLISSKGETKTALRKCLSELIPSQILKRKDKIGFTVPEKHWLLSADEWVNDILLSKHSSEVIHGQLVAERWEAVKEGQVAYSQSIWRAVNLIYWSQSSSVRFV